MKRLVLLLVLSFSAAAQTATTTTFTTQQVTYVVGTPVIFQAYVAPTSATGTLTFKDGAATLGSCTLAPLAAVGDRGSQPQHTGCAPTYTLSQGTHTLTAVYSGDTTYATSTSAAYTNVVSAVATSPGSCASMTTGLNGSLGGYIPAINDGFHQRVDGLPADPNSAAIMADFSVSHLHVDFGSAEYGYAGIPYYVVDSSATPGLPFAIANNGGENYAHDSDILNVWPGSQNTMWIEGHYLAPQVDPNVGVTNGDNHLALLDKATCVDYETYHTQQKLGQNPALTASASATWDLRGRSAPQVRPTTSTSTDGSGLAVFEGLVRYDEVAAGVINHAIRYTTDRFHADHYVTGDPVAPFAFPNTHAADTGSHSTYQHYGERLRLQANYDISGFSAANQVILTAMKQYGLIMSDGGGRFYISGTPDSRWNTDDLLLLQNIPSSNFEVVEEATPYANDRYPTGTAATVTSFTASPSTVAYGNPVTLSVSTTGASYNTVNCGGFLAGNSGSLTFTPTSATTTCTLTTANSFLANDDGTGDGSRNTQSLSVTVTGIPVVPRFGGSIVAAGNIRR